MSLAVGIGVASLVALVAIVLHVIRLSPDL
jgi:hypothetical protein